MMIRSVLLVVKKSSRPVTGWKQLFLLKGRPAWVKADLNRQRQAKEFHIHTVREVEKALREKGLSYRMIERRGTEGKEDVDLVVSVGGDGTFLEAARCVKRDQPIVGVNSDPHRSVGSFCAATAATFSSLLEALLEERAPIRPLWRASVSLNGRSFGPAVLNDLLITHRKPAAMSRYWLKVGRRSETQRSSGLWIATPAGSTGAVLSAGGRPVSRDSRCLQYRPRELYEAAGVAYRLKGGVLSEGQSIQVGSLMREGLVCVDGEHVTAPFRYGDLLTVGMSGCPLRVVAQAGESR